MKILLIDDDKDDQTLFCEAISQISEAIVCALTNNGVEGLEYLRSSDILPDLVFLDINMPLLDGRETLAIIRATEEFRSIPVVMYSTSVAEKEIPWFEAMDAKWIIKPSDFNTLTHLLADHLMLRPIDEQNHTLTKESC